MAGIMCESCFGPVSDYSHGCPTCGAPMCCKHCCDRDFTASLSVTKEPKMEHEVQPNARASTAEKSR